MIDLSKANYGGTPVAPWRKKLAYAPTDPVVQPALSIVTPCFEPGPTFGETVQSVIGQSLQHWEWILVDDGSSDSASLGRLEGLAREDARIRLIRHAENRGRSAARNTGIEAARTAYVYPLDQDDLLEPTALEKTLWCLVTHPEHAFVNGWCVGFGAQSYLWNRGFDAEELFLVENQVSGRAMIRRTVFERIGGYDESFRDGFEDWDFWLRCAEQGVWGATIPEYLEWFRRNSPPASWEDPARVAECRALLRARHPRLVSGGFPKVVQRSAEVVPATDSLPFANRLAPHARRLVVVASELEVHSNGALLLGAVEVLAKQGWRVTIAVATASDGDACEKALARHTADLHVMDHFLPAGEQARFLRYLVASRGPAAVLCETSVYGRVMARYLRARCPGPFYVGLAHDDPNRGGKVEEALAGGPGRSPFDQILAATRPLAQQLAAWAERVEYVPPAVDTKVWKPRREPRRWLRPHWGAHEDELVVLVAGRLCERNRPQILLRTLLEFARREIPFRAVIQGEGDGEEWLRAALRRHGLESRVRIEETPSADWLLKSMAAADVFFSPSRAGLPVSLLRAMAMCLPVVASATDAIADVVDASVGTAVEAGDEDAETVGYANALERLARDAPLRLKLGRGARSRVLGRFGLDRAAARLLEILAAPRARPGALERPPTDAFARAAEYALLRACADPIARARRELARSAVRQADRIRELEARNGDLARARSWLEGQLEHWQATAKERERLLGDKERGIQDLDKARHWLEGQREHWASIAKQRERLLTEQERRIQDLDKARHWLEGQRKHWASIAKQRERLLTEQERRIQDLDKARAWLDDQRQNWATIAARREQLLAKKDSWIRQLDSARNWLDGQRENWQKLAAERGRRATHAEDEAKRWQQVAEERAQQAERWRQLAETLEAEATRLDAENEQLVSAQVAVAQGLAELAGRWWPGALRSGAAEASRRLLLERPNSD